MALPEIKMNEVRRRCSPFCANFHTAGCPAESTGEKSFQRVGDVPLTDYCFKPNEEVAKINLCELAETFLFHNPVRTDKRTFVMYRHDGRVWVDDAESEIQRWLVETEGDHYHPHHLTALTQIIQAKTFEDSLEEPPPNYLCFENGVLDLDHPEEGLRQHSPRFFFRNMIRAEYNPEARPFKFLEWLEEVLPGEEERKFAQELVGYCFLRAYPIHKVFFLVGSGRNGKSTFLRTIIDLIGDRSCSSVPIERLGERFQNTNLIGKLVNISSEPKSSLTLMTEPVKQATGEDLISGEIKGKQKQILFKNYAKIIVNGNKLTPVKDESVAWWERVEVLEFPNEFVGDKQIPQIEKRWLSDPVERSGIVNWALEGLKRLFERNGFTKSGAMQNVVENYRRWSQPVKYFVEKYCKIGLNEWVTKEELYEAYKKVAEEDELEVLDAQTFALEIRKVPRVQVVQKRIGSKKERIWKGISLKVEQLEQLEQPSYTLGKIEESKIYRSIEKPVPVAPVVPPPSQDPDNKDPHLTAFMDIFNSLQDGLSVTDFWKPFLRYALGNNLPESYVKAFLEDLEERGLIFVDKLRGVVKKASGGVASG